MLWLIASQTVRVTVDTCPFSSHMCGKFVRPRRPNERLGFLSLIHPSVKSLVLPSLEVLLGCLAVTTSNDTLDGCLSPISLAESRKRSCLGRIGIHSHGLELLDRSDSIRLSLLLNFSDIMGLSEFTHLIRLDDLRRDSHFVQLLIVLIRDSALTDLGQVPRRGELAHTILLLLVFYTVSVGPIR